MVFSFLLGANVLVEKVFAWPGIGSYALEALIASDYAPVQGFVLTMASLYVLLNLAIDMLYGADRPAREDRGVSALLRHARYVLGENPVTAARLRAASCCWSCWPSSGPGSRPTIRWPATPRDAAAALARALVRHRPARPRHPEPRARGHAARPRDRGRARWRCRSRWAARGGVAPASSAAGPTGSSRRLTDTIMAFPLFVLAMGIVAALGNTRRPTSCSPPRSSTCRSTRAWRAPRSTCAARPGFVEAARLAGNGAARVLAVARASRTACRR